MANPASLLELFGDFVPFWPPKWIKPEIGIGLGTANDLTVWLADLDQAVSLAELRPGSAGGRIGLHAKVGFDGTLSSFSGAGGNGFPFVFQAMPDVEFRIQNFPDPGDPDALSGHLFVSRDENDVAVLIEGLPVEIRLPIGMLRPHPDAAAGAGFDQLVTVGEFTAGVLDSQRIVYRDETESSIFVHIRLRITAERQIVITPAVPISFGRCRFLDVPCLAVHDFQLIPSPGIATDNIDWLRHEITAWPGIPTDPIEGCFAARSIHLDPAQAPTKAVADKLQGSATENPLAVPGETPPRVEFVIDDLVLPFFSQYVLPVPRHLTAGIRRAELDATDRSAVFEFEKAPVRITFGGDPPWGLLIESFFYQSLPFDQIVDAVDPGITFSAIFFFSDKEKREHGIIVELGENFTPRLGYRRNFDVATDLPEGQDNFNPLHFEIAGTVIVDIIGARVGYSIGRAVGEDLGFGDCFELLLDIFVDMPPTGSDDAKFRLRSLNGERVQFALEGIGWRQGGPSFGGISLPDGVIITIYDFGIILQELAFLAEDGATYFSFSGGLAYAPPTGFAGGVAVKRLRFRIAGNPDAPSPKIDGVFAFFRSPQIYIEIGGYFTDTVVDGTEITEVGLTGTLGLNLSAVNWLFQVDFIAGKRRPAVGGEFKYMMIQLVFEGMIPIYWLEVRGARLLYAHNMLPDLGEFDAQSGEFRYFNWYVSSDPLRVPGDRRLASWRAEDDSFTAGIGVTLSISSVGAIARLRGFVLGLKSPDEAGMLITLELMLFQSNDPVAYAVVELDFENDRIGVLFGVELSAKVIFEELPSFLADMVRVSGTLIMANKPGTFAIGRLRDQHTWLGIVFEWEAFGGTAFFRIAFCVERVEGGPKGVGFVMRFEGGFDWKALRLSYYAGFGVSVSSFTTGSGDYAALIYLEIGGRVVLFGFLRLGLSLRAELRKVGADPELEEASFRIRFETPWYLPDFTWKMEYVRGSLAPDALGVAAPAMRSAALKEEKTSQSLPSHVERFDRIDPFDEQGGGGESSETFSIRQLRAGGRAEAQRLQAFADNDKVRPVSPDSSIAIDFAVTLDDLVGVGGVDAEQGSQSAGDLALKYELTRVRIRRRRRFGSVRPWRVVDQATEQIVQFTDTGGVELSGQYGPEEITLQWAPDIRIEGKTATKKLMINSTTPYDFLTGNPEADEELVREHPSWPCCRGHGRKPTDLPYHQVIFRDLTPGTVLVAPQRFSQATSLLRIPRHAVARPKTIGTAIPPGAVVAAFLDPAPGLLFGADLDEDAAICVVRLAWQTGHAAELLLLGLDRDGQEVARQSLQVTGARDQHSHVLVARQGPIRRLELWLRPGVLPQSALAAVRKGLLIELDRVVYLALDDRLAMLREEAECRNEDDRFRAAYEGRGHLFFMPNHQYEIEIETRITITHPSTDPESATVSEYTYFETKGLPGLNAQERVGEEIEPYVDNAYSGGHGLVYREEPVALSFTEHFLVAVPLALRPAGNTDERNQLFQLALTTRPDTAPAEGASYTATAEDWIAAHRQIVPGALLAVSWTATVARSFGVVSETVSTDPFKARLAAMTQRPNAQCPLNDPREVVHPVLIAMPQGSPDPDDPSRELWPAAAGFSASARPKDAGFIDRDGFIAADQTAFDFAVDAAVSDGSAWNVADGRLGIANANARQFAIFGENDWNHLTVLVSVELGAGLVGIGFGLPDSTETNVPSRGLFAVVETTQGGRQLAIYRRRSGTQFVRLDQAALPDGNGDPVTLTIHAFDDRLRVSAADTHVEAAREELRDGRLALVAKGTAAFSALKVQGLEVFTYPFRTSRFVGFAGHIGSFGGRLDTLRPDDLGANTTTGTVAEFWSQTGSEVRAAMAPVAAIEERQKLFSQCLTTLGLPLRDEVVALGISRFEEAGRTAALLLESPEPIDFTEEVSVTLEQRIILPGRRRALHEGLLQRQWFLDLISEALGHPVREPLPPEGRLVPRRLDLPPRPDGPEPGDPLSALIDALGGGPRRDLLAERAVERLVSHLETTRSGIRLDFDPEAVAGEAMPRHGMKIAVARFTSIGADGRVTLEVLRGEVKRKSTGQLFATAKRVHEINTEFGLDSAVLSQLRHIAEGATIIVDWTSGAILDFYWPTSRYRSVELQVLQSPSAKAALVIPLSGANARKLPAGHYRMSFVIDRSRWQTTSAPDELNSYRDSATLSFTL